MAEFFEFEADFVKSLRCIPMQVRYHLDMCGIKLKLPQWEKFNLADRQQLADHPTNNAAEIQKYRELLVEMIRSNTGETATELAIDPAPPWSDLTVIPDLIQSRCRNAGLEISLEQWSQLSSLQRFALLKLSGSSHEQNNFVPALKEFGLQSVGEILD
jgi:hypothetical protein